MVQTRPQGDAPQDAGPAGTEPQGADLSTADFDFDLPERLIAQEPCTPRDAARLLCVGAGLADRQVRDLPQLLRRGDIMVVNDTRVIPAQLSARRGTARIGITLDQPQPDGSWTALLRNARRVRVQDALAIDGMDGFTAEVVHAPQEGMARLRFNLGGDAFAAALAACGSLALPPYIAREQGPTARDARDYQTQFARVDGAVAAPTAGLHFTPALLAALEHAGIARVAVTLHVGAGTFLPVRSERLSGHVMHRERGEIRADVAAAINRARQAGGRVLAIGTTSLRLLESACAEDGSIMPFEGDTGIFIHPPYRVRSADLLLTNFHLPRSTLMMLVCAFAGTARMRAAYAHAIAQGYRFFSYGDASLLERA